MTVAAVEVPNYVAKLPGGLLRKLFAGHWLPIVGAGISATAVSSERGRLPLWGELGDLLGAEVSAHLSNNPIDSISAYSELYGRSALVERLMDLLLIDDAEPSPAHLAFARIPFDMVVTTNADFLLESAYQQVRRPCIPLIGESQLSIARRAESISLLKFHGDLRHPEDLVMTEEDYDGFLRRKPLLATYMSWWLLTREPVIFGYSLDDGDLREILALLRERLGKLTRAGWAILPTDKGGRQAPKFARRGIKAIVLEEDEEADRETILARFFAQLRDAWEREVLPDITAPTDSIAAELRRE